MHLIPLLAWLQPPTHAVQPSDTVWIGIEPQRVATAHPPVQAGWRAGETWSRFTDAFGPGWTVRFDEASGAARAIWGQGVPVPTHSADAVLTAVTEHLAAHRDLLGATEGTWVSRSAEYSPAYDTWYLHFDVLRDGLPTYRGGISARVKHGRLILITTAGTGALEVRGSYGHTADQAIATAIAGGPAPGIPHTDAVAEPWLLEIHDRSGLHLRRTWWVRTETADPPGQWFTFVDGQTAAILSVHNNIRFLDGTVTARHHPRTLDGTPLIDSPVPYVFVQGSLDSDLTDVDGQYTLSEGGPFATDFDGDYLETVNSTGPEGVLSSNDVDLYWTTADATQAEIDTYVFTHQAKAWGEIVEPNVGIVFDPLRATVNISASCNAYYNGNINFYLAGGGCNNTGEIADVVYHEWGHGFHSDSYTGGFTDGSLGEGAADIVAFLQTGDAVIAPYFNVGGSGIRDVAPDKIYPDDIGGSVHANGLIIGGTLWDLWGLLDAEHGPLRGKEITEQIFAGMLKGAADIAGTYPEALVADDDNGNLFDGTPNQCALLDAFGRHGLADPLVVVPGHVPLVHEPHDSVTEAQFVVQSTAQSCAPLYASDATVQYRIDGGDWLDAPTAVQPETLVGSIPEQPLGAFVEYFVEGIDNEGRGFRSPPGGGVAPYSYFSGGVIALDCQDFEADDGGYTHELLAGTVSDGADDWQWGSPTGSSGDPAFAYSGGNVWGNDLGGEGFNGAYQADKRNRLTGPPIDTAHYTDVFVTYRRWLSVEDGRRDRASVLANDQIVWSNVRGTGLQHHEDSQWISHSVDLLGLADRGSVALAFEIQTDGAGQLGGWTIDDVCLYAPASGDNRFAILDLVATDLGGPIELTWTQPEHGPIDEVVIVRRTDTYPLDRTDGEVIASIVAPQAGTAGAFVHPNYDGTSGFYAVYAGQGEDWLTWTIEGWNAAHAAPNEGQPMPEEPMPDTTSADEVPVLVDGRTGCGCTTAPPPVGWLFVSVGLLGIRRRS